VGVGGVLIALGCYAAVMRRRGTSRKMEAMQKFFGPRAGLALHWTLYTVLPIVYGAVSIMLGFQGKSFF
jgi:hypothetical protein